MQTDTVTIPARSGIKADIPESWVSILAGEEDWPPLWGLYLTLPTDGVAYHSSSFSFMPVTHLDTDRVVAAQMVMNGVVFHLMLGRPNDPSAWSIYLPRTLIFEQSGIEKFAEISWSNDDLQMHLRLSRVGTYDGPPPDWPPWARSE